MGLFRRRNVVEVIGLAGPTSAGGATMNVYLYSDGSTQTIEFDWLGRELAKYEGEPRHVPDGVVMPEPPPRPAGAAPLPPMSNPMPPVRPTLERRTPTVPTEADRPAPPRKGGGG